MGRRAACQCGRCPPCRNRAKVAAWQRDNRDKYNAKQRRWSKTEKGRERRRAWMKVKRAIESGALVRPNVCATPGCTNGPPLDAHHDDYSRPLDVKFLCERCHDEAEKAKQPTTEVHDDQMAA